MFHPERDVSMAHETHHGIDTNLVLLRLELAVTSLLRERLALRGNGRKTLRTDILNNRSDETRWCGHSDRDVSLLVPTGGSIKQSRTIPK